MSSDKPISSTEASNYYENDEHQQLELDTLPASATAMTRASIALRNFFPKEFENVEDEVRLSPLQKLLKYRRIPWRIFIDLTLCLILFLLVMFMSMYKKPYNWLSAQSFVRNFLPKGFEDLKENTDGFHTFYFSEMGEVVKAIGHVSQTYFTYAEKNVDTYIYPEDNREIHATVTLFKNNLRTLLTGKSNSSFVPNENLPSISIFDDWKNGVYTVKEVLTQEKPLGQFFSKTGEDLRIFFDTLQYYSLDMVFITLDTSETQTKFPECVRWYINIELDFNSRYALLPMRIRFDFSDCTVKYSPAAAKFSLIPTWFSICALILSLISISIITYNSIKRTAIFIRSKQQTPSIPLSNILEYVTWWDITSVVKDISIITGSVLLLLPRTEDRANAITTATSLFLGFGSLVCYISCVQYLRYAPRFYILISALSNGLPSIARFLISIFPIFIGYAIAGTCWFGHYTRYFESFSATFVTLMALILGDELRKVFDKLYGINRFYQFLGRLYLYSFLMLFIYACLNITLLIMEEAYFSLLQAKQDEQKLESEHVSHEEEEEFREKNNSVRDLSKLTGVKLTTDSKLRSIFHEIKRKTREEQQGKLLRTQLELLREIKDLANKLLET